MDGKGPCGLRMMKQPYFVIEFECTLRPGQGKIDPSACTPEEPGLYLENGRVMQDFVEDFLAFYPPKEL
jgi:hypothetical protein